MSKDLERTRPVDVTGRPDPLEDVDAKASPMGAAMQMFGKPYGELTRSNQIIIDDILRGRRREIEENLRAMRQNNALTVHERISRSAKAMDEVSVLRDMMIQDGAELITSDDLNVSEISAADGGLVKTRAGTIRRNLRHMKTLMKVLKTHTEIEVMLAKLYEEKSAATFIKNDNRQAAIVASPEDVANRLGRFGKGGGDDGQGTENVFEAGDEDQE